VLRHQPEKIGLTLDAQGWADVDELLAKMKQRNTPLTRAQLDDIVAQDDKQRYAFNADGTRLRANQGHSIKIDLGLEPITPPEHLYHGTATRFAESIRQHGLLRGKRDYVHLSPDTETARKVGSRHGEALVLVVNAGEMHAAGYIFYRSANGVWLIDHVPSEYLNIRCFPK
jgi:putative RNA 2'-phosphotransferase